MQTNEKGHVEGAFAKGSPGTRWPVPVGKATERGHWRRGMEGQCVPTRGTPLVPLRQQQGVGEEGVGEQRGRDVGAGREQGGALP